MNVEVFSLCDAATTDVGGKLNMLGAFDTIWATTTPILHPQCAVAIRIRFEHDERGDHVVAINFVDLDGRHIIPTLNGTVNINFSNEQRSGSVNLVLNIQRLNIQRYGEHAIDLAVDGRRVASLPLFVRQRQ